MKKVVHVITTISRGGAENQLLILARAQHKSGREVEIFYLKGQPELMNDFVESGVKVNSSLYGKNPVLQAVFFRRALKDFNGVIHAHLPRAELIAAVSGCKFIFSRHNAESFFPGAPKSISRSLSRFVSRRSTLGVAISEAVKIFLFEEREISKKCKISVIYYAIETIKYAALNQGGFPVAGYRIGTISRLVPQKDLFTLISSYSIILKKFPTAELIIIGSGPLENQLKTYAEGLGISNGIQWIGRTADTEKFYHSINTFVLSSIYEGFGLVLLEAMSYGVPIVASKVSAIPEVIGFDHPLISELSNPESFATNIEKSFSREKRDIVLAYQAQRLEKFTTQKLIDTLDELYLNL
jgi:glycosyltransferase involved in cell wall biosynthesis